MEENTTARTWVSLLAGVVIVLLVFWLMPAQRFTPRGLVLPAKSTLSPTKSNKIVFYNDEPGNYKVLGLIRVQRHFKQGSLLGQKTVAQKAKALAATLGANGVIVKLFAHTVPGLVPDSQAVYQFWGIAIRTNGQASLNAMPSPIYSPTQL